LILRGELIAINRYFARVIQVYAVSSICSDCAARHFAVFRICHFYAMIVCRLAVVVYYSGITYQDAICFLDSYSIALIVENRAVCNH